MLATEVVDSLQGLELFAEEWNRLCLETPQPTPFQSHAWTMAYLSHRLRQGESWFCVIARDAGRLVGALPLVVTPLRVSGWQRVVLRAPSDPHAPTGDALVAPGRAHDVWPALVNTAARHQPNHLYIDFSRVPEASESVRGGKAGLKGRRAMMRPMGRGAYLPINEDNFEAYRASLSANFRSNLNKAANKLKKLPNVKERFLSGPEATVDLLPRFMEVEAKNWKGRRGSAILMSDNLIAFYTTLCRRLSEAGWLEWHLLDTGDRTIAANLAVRMNSAVHVWKLGYDEDYSRCSPGGMLFERLIRRAYESGEISEISLLTDQPWYERWQMQWHAYYGMRFYPRQATAWVAWALDHGYKWAAQQKFIRRAWMSLRPS